MGLDKGGIKTFLACIIVILSLALVMPVHAQRITDGNYQLDTYPEYCNCDRECNMIGGCITRYADPFYINLNPRKSAEAIAQAEKIGYLGACAIARHNGEPIIAKMTPDCDAAVNAAKNSAQEAENMRIIRNAQNSGSSAANSVISDAAKTDALNTKVITVDFSRSDFEDAGNAQAYPGFIILAFTSGTIILICLFCLIAWIIYLRYKRNELSSEDIMNILRKI